MMISLGEKVECCSAGAVRSSTRSTHTHTHKGGGGGGGGGGRAAENLFQYIKENMGLVSYCQLPPKLLHSTKELEDSILSKDNNYKVCLPTKGLGLLNKGWELPKSL